MPKLLLFAACDRVLIEDRGMASLIQIFQELTVSIKGGGNFAQNAVGPKDWAIYSLWKPSPEEDLSKPFVQLVRVLWPDKSEFQTIPFKFEIQPGRGHQNRFEVVGFPMGQQGDVELNMWLEVDSKRVSEIYTWMIRVKHEIVKE